MTLSLTAKIWLYPGHAAWHFVTVDKMIAAKIRTQQEGKLRRGWGAVAVSVTLGKTKWKTSIFPVKADGTYLLPLKLEVRRKEGVCHGDIVKFKIEL
jgi:hypothetical protein